jgi:chemotaxis protein CheZ
MNYPVLREPAVHDNTSLVAELRDLTCHLRDALERFRLDARVADLAEKEMPDARQRLNHVLALTDQAAHRTLDLVEQSGPPAARTAREAAALAEPWTRFRNGRITVAEYQELLQRMDGFLVSAQKDSEAVRGNLAEVLLAQGYQDLSGQIIRGVMKLVSEVETTLGELGRLSRAVTEIAPADGAIADAGRGFGPPVPGVNTGGTIIQAQDDVDALFSGMSK